MEHIKRIKRELAYKGSIVDFYKDTVLLPNGKTEEWDLVHHRMGAACVVAIDDEGKLIMVHQYRPALDRETLELPAGARDSLEEDTSVCAARELEEETGYKAEKLEKILSLRTTVAFCDEFIDVYLATGLKKTEQHLDEAESIDVEHILLEDALAKIDRFEIQDSKTVSGILAYARIKATQN